MKKNISAQLTHGVAHATWDIFLGKIVSEESDRESEEEERLNFLD